MTRRRFTGDRFTITLPGGAGRQIVRDDVVDFDEVVIPASATAPARTLGDLVPEKYAGAFSPDLAQPAAPPAVADTLRGDDLE